MRDEASVLTSILYVQGTEMPGLLRDPRLVERRRRDRTEEIVGDSNRRFVFADGGSEKCEKQVDELLLAKRDKEDSGPSPPPTPSTEDSVLYTPVLKAPIVRSNTTTGFRSVG